MDLTTRYLGLELASPLMPGASPLVSDLAAVRELEDGGAAAIVMSSLFEEQIDLAQRHRPQRLDESFAEAVSFFPDAGDFALGPDEYLEQLRRVKEVVSVPVIGSLNGATPGGWLEYAALIAEAGADALELNVYRLETDPTTHAATIEEETLDMVRAVVAAVEIPVAVKLSPYYTSMADFARRLDEAGADGLVLFNRFYQADVDVEELEVRRTLQLSDPSELLLRLRWMAILHGRLRASLAVTGGVWSATDVVKAVMSGAHAVQVVSLLLREGAGAIKALSDGLLDWMEIHEYDSLESMRGALSLERCPDPGAYERANYMHVLQNWWQQSLATD